VTMASSYTGAPESRSALPTDAGTPALGVPRLNGGTRPTSRAKADLWTSGSLMDAAATVAQSDIDHHRAVWDQSGESARNHPKVLSTCATVDLHPVGCPTRSARQGHQQNPAKATQSRPWTACTSLDKRRPSAAILAYSPRNEPRITQ
jgi:hypothetical protein